MRIIGGQYKRMKIDYPKSELVRPTMDRVRETLFNILGPKIQRTKILSLFSGGGSMGLEAISRGAEHVTFVDMLPLSIKTIEENIKKLRISPSQYTILNSDAIRALDLLNSKKEGFDFVFMDPPYNKGFIRKSLMKCEGSVILRPLSRLVLEHAKSEPVPEDLNFREVTTRRFGETLITILEENEKKETVI